MLARASYCEPGLKEPGYKASVIPDEYLTMCMSFLVFKVARGWVYLINFISTTGLDRLETEMPTVTELVAVGQAMNLVPSVFVQHRVTYIANIVRQSIGRKLDSTVLSTKIKSIELTYGSKINQFGKPLRDLLWGATFKLGIPHLAFLGPPVASCFTCDSQLRSHNPPSTVVCYGFDGPIPGLKITLRCVKCGLNYRYILF